MSADDKSAKTAPLVLFVLLILGVFILTSGRVASFQLVDDEFSPVEFPVAAVAAAREAGLDDLRMFNEYRWGGYILYAWPEQTIFIDGMANFFGSDLMEEYVATLQGGFGWEASLRDRGIDILILPPEAPLAQIVSRSPDWSRWYGDSTAVIMRHQGGRAVITQDQGAGTAVILGDHGAHGPPMRGSRL